MTCFPTRKQYYVEKAIRPSDGNVKAWRPLDAFREEQAMRRHRVSPSPFLSSSSLTTQLHYTYSHPNLKFVQHCADTLPTRNVVCPSGAWFENRPHLTPSIRLARYPKRVIVQWVGIRTDRQNAVKCLRSDSMQMIRLNFREKSECLSEESTPEPRVWPQDRRPQVHEGGQVT